MAKKGHLAITKKTRTLFNEIKGNVIKNNPSKNFNNDQVLCFILIDYKKLKGGAYGRAK